LSAPRHVRPVSYYALFKGWLLLSQPPGCLRAATTLPTKLGFRDLSRRSGLFPSRPRIFAPAASLLGSPPTAFDVWHGSVSGKPPHRTRALPPLAHSRRLHLNAFRGEPAISEFAWHFTSTHSSSRHFVTCPGADLHERVPPASPWPWVAHPVSGRLTATLRPFGLAFAPAPPVPGLAYATASHSSAHSPKGTPSPNNVGSDRPEAHGFRIYFTPRTGVLFTVPSRYWFTLGRLRYLALGGGPPRFPPDITCPAVLTQITHCRSNAVAYGSLTLFGTPFQQVSAAS